MTATPKPTTDQRNEALAEYGWSLSVINSSPDLKKLFNTAVDKGYTPARFVAELQDTKWFKTQTANQRQADIERTVDPKTFAAKQATTKADLQTQAQAMGATVSDKQLNSMVDSVTNLGWDQTQVKNALASYVTISNSGPDKGQYIGAAGQSQQALMQTALANGYNISDTDMAKWQKAISTGTSTVADYQTFMRRQAALTFPSFSDELLAGADMKDVANPYINSMSTLLEIPPDQINLNDPTLKKGLASTNPSTGKPTALSVPDFETQLRQDPRWQYTQNAKQTAASTVLQLGRTMGLA